MNIWWVQILFRWFESFAWGSSAVNEQILTTNNERPGLLSANDSTERQATLCKIRVTSSPLQIHDAPV